MNFILDTCIWRDFYEDRFSKIGRPLGSFANKLLVNILRKRDKILYSEALIWELRLAYEEKEIQDLLQFLILNNTLLRIEITEKDYQEANILSKYRNLPFVDCLNAVHARNHEAILISQDAHMVHELKDIAKASRPEDFI